MFPINIIWKTLVASVLLLRSEQHVAQWQQPDFFAILSRTFEVRSEDKFHWIIGHVAFSHKAFTDLRFTSKNHFFVYFSLSKGS